MQPPTDGYEGSKQADEAAVTHLTVVETVVEEETVVYWQEDRRAAVHASVAWLLLDRARSMMSLLVVAAFALTFLAQPFRIPSESMERTLLVGDFLLVNKAIYGPAGMWGWLLPYREPRRGDVVVFRFPLDPDDHVVKRVIGSSGDLIHLHDDVVYRNGVPLREPYTAQPAGSFHSGYDAFRDDFPVARFTDPGVDAHWWTVLQRGVVHGELTVPSQHFFVMGDNRDHSRDSRYWGYVPRENIVGMPLLIYFSVREPSRTDPPPQPVIQRGQGAENDRLAKSEGNRLLDFARWDRTLRVVY